MKATLVFLGLVAIIGVFAWSVWSGVRSGSPEAAIIDIDSSDQPTPTTFPEPTPIMWTGLVTRAVAGGRGIEVRSAEAEGGWFFAYRADNEMIEYQEGSVHVTGLWHGISCEYGRCAPEIEIQDIEPAN